MPTYTGNITTIASGGAGTGGTWTIGAGTLPASHPNLSPGQTTGIALLTLGASIVIPANEVVVGVQYDLVETMSAGSGTHVLARPILGGVVSGSNLANSIAWGTPTFGGATEMWGLSFATTDFGTSFGIAIQAEKTVAPGQPGITSGVVTVYTLIPTDQTPFQYLGSNVEVY